MRALVILPLVLPPVVAGVGLLQALGRRGIVGGWLDRVAGIQVTFTTAGAVIAATFVSIPLVVLSAEAGFRSLDPITFAGNLEGRTQTLPLAVFQKLQTDQEGAIALSLVLVILSICVLVALRERITGTG